MRRSLLAVFFTAMTLSHGLPAQRDAAEQVAPRPGTDRVLTAFGPGDWKWTTVLDGVMGGRSSGRFTIEGGVMRFTGTLNTNGGGFSSMRTGAQPTDLTGYAGIRLRVRGDGRTYQMRLNQQGLRGGVSYRAEFRAGTEASKGDIDGSEWKDVWLPFESFLPAWRGRRLDLPNIDPARISGFGLTMADGIDGDFELQALEIAAYAPFDMDQLLWQKRPLVVCAPSAEAERATAWRAAFVASERACRERDMVLVELYEDGTSRVDDRRLTAAEARELRTRFGTEPGSFQAVLVGKDGGTKRRFEGAPQITGLFATIDSMPMRREEIARRKGRDT